MEKKTVKFMLIYLCLVSAFTSTATELYDDLALIQSSKAELSSKDKAALHSIDIMEERQLSGVAVNPGQIQFIYGNGIPTVVCALLEISDIVMQENEHILSVQLGDTSRWVLDSVVSGSENKFTEHLIVKPLDTGLTTSILIATDKRSYHLRLKSSAKDFMPLVKFSYPEESSYSFNGSKSIVSSASAPHKTYSVSNQNKETNDKNEVLFARNYGYEISGNERILPVNAYDDGEKTYIQLNDSYYSSALPTVMEVTDDGSVFFPNESLTALNYSLLDNTFVIEGIYDHLRLIETRGSSEIRADIRRV